MKLIIGNAAVSCYIDLASLLVMILLLSLSDRIRRQKTRSNRSFYLLFVQITFTCIICFVFNAMEGHSSPLSHQVALFSRSLWELSVIISDCLWLAYVDQKLYVSRRGRLVRQILRVVIVLVYVVLLTVNLFNGMIFTLSGFNTLERKPLSYWMLAADFLIFVSAAISVWRFDRKTAKTRFLRVSPMIVSILISILPQFFTPYNTGIVGYAVGVTMLYFSMASEIRFLDEESGMYNRVYLSYLIDLAFAGKKDYRSVLILDVDGNLPAVFEIFRDILHREGDVIRADRKKFLMFSGSESRSTVQYLSSLVEEAVAKHNADHPENKIQMKARCMMRRKKEDAYEFLHSVLDEKETGDEMRGIVSMITELDRLDKELSMAADIQKNILPMNFPPFPDRKEFSLYASMTPAKEVGGDFYDFFLTDNDHLGLVIADVSDKGIPAALFMMASKTLIKNYLMSGDDPAEALKKANVQLQERNSSMMFVTVWLAVLEISTGKGIACNAGHEKPAIRRAGGPFELLEYKHDRFVGAFTNVEYHSREFELKAGDSLFVYTDGVLEAVNESKEEFGEERFLDALNRNAGAEPEELIRQVHKAVNGFAGDAPQFDDLTMLSVKYYGVQSSVPE